MNALDILDKFKGVTIDNTQQIAEADRAFCEAEEKLYNAAVSLYLNAYNELLKQWEIEMEQSEYRKQATGYIHEYVDNSGKYGIDKLKEKLMDIHHCFIDNICRYFSHVYDIKIESSDIIEYLGYGETSRDGRWRTDKEQYQQTLMQTMSYKPIVDKIILDLGGHSFDEKVIKEIKGNALKAAYNRYRETKPNFVIKKAKIIFEGLTYSSNSYGEYEISLDKDDYRAILRALTHFNSEGKQTSIYNGWVGRFIGYHKRERDGIYDTHETTGARVTHFKYFKNGKWEIIFKDHQTTLDFAKEYLDYRS